MNRTSVIFKNPYEIELRRDTLPSSREGEVIIKTHMSAISAGTEMLVYRGQFPPTLPVDDNIKALTHKFEYPLKYGYTSIGHVPVLIIPAPNFSIKAVLPVERVFSTP